MRDEPATLDAAAIASAYRELRGKIARDPLFADDADDQGVSLDELDRRMQQAPPRIASADELYRWLDGADPYRYAGLLVLERAMGGGPAEQLTGRVTVPEATARIARGDLAIDGDLVLEAGAMLVVLGKLAVTGALVGAEFDYTLVAAREIACARGMTGGELIASERIAVPGEFYFAGNDYSARAPRYEGGLLVDFERANAFTHVAVERRLTAWSFEDAATALGVATDRDLASAYHAKLLTPRAA
jgi:hypothetical protein